MKNKLKELIKTAFEKFSIGITSSYRLQELMDHEKDINVFLNLPNEKTAKLISLIEMSKSQLKQDLFVLSELNFKNDGFFVEFGATNGIDLSNTYILEKEFGWKGILAEPAKYWHDDLKSNRSCNIETNCVWRNSNSVLNFNETNVKEVSTISAFNNSDGHKKARTTGTNYNVHSISLINLLDKYNAPKTIDYLSIDTEGSEYDILSTFDFSKYQFSVITCEHNYTRNREKIFYLLTNNGYVRKNIGSSKFDDWYVKL